MKKKFRYLVIQDYIKQVYEGESYKDCIDYLKLIMEEQPDYNHHFNEKDGTLSLQDPYSCEILTTFRAKIIDLRYSPGGDGKYDGLDIARILTS